MHNNASLMRLMYSIVMSSNARLISQYYCNIMMCIIMLTSLEYCYLYICIVKLIHVYPIIDRIGHIVNKMMYYIQNKSGYQDLFLNKSFKGL